LHLHPQWKGKVTFVFVKDIASPGAFRDVFMQEKIGFDYIIHTASPVNFSVTDFQKDLIDPAVQGTIELLKCAHEIGGQQLKRFVLLGSAVSVLNSFQDESVPGPDYTESDWNPVTAAKAIESKSAVLGYNASKKLAEEAAWKYLEDNKPSFDLTVINPDIIIGPMLQPVNGPKNVNETNEFAIYNFLNGTYKHIEGLTFPFYHFVDVRDVSRAHVMSLTNPATSNQRILLVSGLITPQIVINIIQRHFPGLRERIMEGKPSQTLPDNVKPTGWNVEKSYKVFGKGWDFIDVETSVVDTVKDLLRLEKEWEVHA
jgi:nucleoside-diphosphate-sugar epimerase